MASPVCVGINGDIGARVSTAIGTSVPIRTHTDIDTTAQPR